MQYESIETPTKDEKQSYREIRGIKWCSSTRCRNF